MKSQIFSIVCLVLLLSACQDTEKQNSTQKTIPEINVANVSLSKQKLSSIFSLKNTIYLQSKDRKPIGKIDKVAEHQGKIYVLDRFINKELYVFSVEGEFLGTVGQFGDGEGAYQQPYDFLIDELTNEIEILTPGQIMYYDLATRAYKKANKIEYPATRFAKTKDNYAFVGGIDSYQLILCKLNFERVMEYLPFEQMHAMLPFDSFVRTKDGKLLFYRNFDNTIYEVKKDIVEAYADINYGQDKIAEAEKASISSPKDVFKKFPNKKLLFNFFYESTDKYLLAYMENEKPAFVVRDKKTDAMMAFDITKVENDLTDDPYFPMLISSTPNNELFAAVSLEGKESESAADYKIVKISVK